ADIFILIYIQSSCIDRSASADDCNLNVELLIEKLRDIIMKELSKLFMTVKFNIVSTFILINIFEMIDLYQSILWCLLSDFIIQMKNICVFRNKNTDAILFYIYK
ncbi:hypothetical protein BDDG_05670, partial [Blastomyces dermatitidis ATCC 18188]